MIIANPMYSATLTLLLENDRAAKFFIGAVLGCEVRSLEHLPPEHFEPDDKTLPNISLFRKKFAAAIATKEGGEKKVIIEIQKVCFLMELYRFWEHHGKEYAASTVPIITIYILGVPISVDSPAFETASGCRDLLTKKELAVHDPFVRQLAHSACFIQTPRIKPSANTKLDTKIDRLLSILEQANFIGGDKIMKDYTLELDDPEAEAVTTLLRYIATDSQAYRALEKESYYMNAMEGIYGERDKKFAAAIQKKEEEAKQREEETKK